MRAILLVFQGNWISISGWSDLISCLSFRALVKLKLLVRLLAYNYVPLYVRCIVTKYRNDKKKRIINNPKYIPLLPHCCKNIVCVQNFNFRQVWILPPKLADIQNHLSNWVFKNQIHYFASFSWIWIFEQKWRFETVCLWKITNFASKPNHW